MEKRFDNIIGYSFHIRPSEEHTHLIHHKLVPMLPDRAET